MADKIVLSGTAVTAATTGATWVEQANSYGQLAVTVICSVVGVATLWYTLERARKLRRERKEKE